ncbi:MAG: type II toxin-antitoxin system Phd/YefM family antitoxin [Lacisediminihabitans sp.]
MNDTGVQATTVSLYEAKTHLSELGDRAASGEEIVVTKHGKPRFRLVAVDAPVRRPGPGEVDLKISSADRRALANHDWFSPDEEIERMFGTRG